MSASNNLLYCFVMLDVTAFSDSEENAG